MNLACFCFKTLDLCVCILLTGELGVQGGLCRWLGCKGHWPLNNRMKGKETRILRTLIRLGFLLWWDDFQNKVTRLVYSFWRVYCSKAVRMRNKTKDRYCFMRSCFSEMVSLSKELMLISSKVCEALTLESCPTFLLVYPVKEFYKLGTFL